ncbi:hypothetical protein MKW94_024433 [Papaver nudicaule]|uniref:Uncharacterized protein n=1 Tax=Papaver nudicaule TaxID=74823 RepID=A0AA42AYT7_PAPNU|nr:hypothetical protein [Papaver nudicaule]
MHPSANFQFANVIFFISSKFVHEFQNNLVGESMQCYNLFDIACNKYMTKFAGKYAFQQDAFSTGMRGAFGEPLGICARVSIGQVLLSVRCKDNNREALCRAKFRFPGPVLIKSRNTQMVKLLGCHGRLARRQPGRAFLDAVAA